MKDDFCVHDNILLPITYNDLVLMAQNINPAKHPDLCARLRTELIQVIRERAEDALHDFDSHIDDIFEAAFPDETREENPLGEEKTAELAKMIYDFLLTHEMWMDIAIYFNGICWSTNHKDENGNFQFRYNGEPFITEADPHDYFDYVGPTLSMSFEGALYDVINYTGGKLLDEFNQIFNRFGMYYELGNAWNLSVYPI